MYRMSHKCVMCQLYEQHRSPLTSMVSVALLNYSIQHHDQTIGFKRGDEVGLGKNRVWTIADLAMTL